MRTAEQGTVREGNLVYVLDGKTHLTPIQTLRGDYRDADGNTANLLRPWGKQDFIPHTNDIFQERLYFIQWYQRDTLGTHRQTAFFAAPTKDDLQRETKLELIVGENIGKWQERGILPDLKIEPGGPPRYQGKSLLMNFGWRYWHHLFNARQLLLFALLYETQRRSPYDGAMGDLASALNRSFRLSRWHSADKGREGPQDVFSNLALNGLFNYGARAFLAL